jgi:hypothetical protein
MVKVSILLFTPVGAPYVRDPPRRVGKVRVVCFQIKGQPHLVGIENQTVISPSFNCITMW